MFVKFVDIMSNPQSISLSFVYADNIPDNNISIVIKPIISNGKSQSTTVRPL